MRDFQTAQAAADALAHGGVIAYPTEAVWGLGCDPFDQAAVMRLLDIKQRAVDKGLILVADSPDALAPLLEWEALPAERRVAVLDTWPGPHTWLVPATTRVPRWITGQHATLAVRVSAHPVVRDLCRAFAGPIVSTSANPTGAPAPRSFAELDATLLARLDGYLHGDTGGLAAPTPIRDAHSGAVLRGN
jgi:L-threonylcarbamoyladenylate synthase